MTYKPKNIIKDREAKKIFNVLVQILTEENKMNSQTLLIVDNFALLEQLKQDHIKDIAERGVIEHFVNGSQEFYRENKSVQNVLKIVEQQRKLQSELKLTPSSDKKVTEVVETKADDFDEF